MSALVHGIQQHPQRRQRRRPIAEELVAWPHARAQSEKLQAGQQHRRGQQDACDGCPEQPDDRWDTARARESEESKERVGYARQRRVVHLLQVALNQTQRDDRSERRKAPESRAAQQPIQRPVQQRRQGDQAHARQPARVQQRQIAVAEHVRHAAHKGRCGPLQAVQAVHEHRQAGQQEVAQKHQVGRSIQRQHQIQKLQREHGHRQRIRKFGVAAVHGRVPQRKMPLFGNAALHQGPMAKVLDDRVRVIGIDHARAGPEPVKEGQPDRDDQSGPHARRGRAHRPWLSLRCWLGGASVRRAKAAPSDFEPRSVWASDARSSERMLHQLSAPWPCGR